MANEKFVIRCHQQNRERSFAPILPYTIPNSVRQSKGFCQTNAIDLTQRRLRLRKSSPANRKQNQQYCEPESHHSFLLSWSSIRFHSSIAGSAMMRNTLPPLASSDFLDAPRLSSFCSFISSRKQIIKPYICIEVMLFLIRHQACHIGYERTLERLHQRNPGDSSRSRTFEGKGLV